MATENRGTIRDVRALTALAHPIRIALLDHLMTHGPRTASQCAAVVDASPSACSYHLRQLAKWGLVEPAPEGDADGRERPWRAAVTGFDLAVDPGNPAAVAAEQAFAAVAIEAEAGQARAFLRRLDEVPDDWRDVSGLSRYGLRLTAAELADLRARLDEAIRPFIVLTRSDPPADAVPVRLSVQAFPEEPV